MLETSEALEFALKTARQAGELLCEYTHRHYKISHKSTEIDLVTEADTAAERMIVDAIRREFPQHTILSEEGLGDLQELARAECLWLVDPLDGTVNYAHGFPVWGVSLALADHGQVVMGVSYDPLGNEMFWAERGRGAWCGDKKLHVSQTDRLRDALVATGFAYKRATIENNNLPEFGAVMPRVQGVRRAGAAILDMAYLAAGRLDGYWEMHLNPWDWAAGWLFVEEAGGTVTDLQGDPWTLSKEAILASNGRLHARLLDALRGAD